MLGDFFKRRTEEQFAEADFEYFDPEQDLWTVFEIVKNKDRREFNKFIKGTQALYEAWVNYQPRATQDETVEQELAATETALGEMQGGRDD